ncbi:MAG: transcription antitermination factor NusB [Scrofimicrobium sp.]
MNNGGPKGRRGSKSVDAPRLLAARALVSIDEDAQFANLLLPKMLREEQSANPRFSPQDAAFVSELVYGTTRRQRTLDQVLTPLSTKPLDQLDAPVRACLRLGAYQLMYMRVPDHAAVSETVSVARELSGDGPSKTVNAVLRSLLRQGTDEALTKAVDSVPRQYRLGIEQSHPDWIVDAFRESLRLRGFPETTVGEALEANNTAAQVTLAARPGLVDPQDLAEEAEDVLRVSAYQGNLAETSVILSGGDPGALPSLRAGDAGVQDEGSQFAALLLAGAPLGPGPDSKWLDLCAGPGGKAALLAAVAKQRGATVTANEVSPRRARLIERSVQALDNVTVTVEDGREIEGEDLYDRVLVDAPCLGLGSLRRRPESRWRHSESDLDELLPLQRGLLDAGIRLARPGGVIAWVTCSPHRSETVDQVARVVEDGGVSLLNVYDVAAGLTLEDLRGAVSVPEGLAPTPEAVLLSSLQLWPHIHKTDAMYIALLKKEEVE